MSLIPIQFGGMSLDGDEQGHRDAVSAILINGYRTTDGISRIPGLKPFCALGSGSPAYIHFSTLYGAFLAVAGGNLYAISRGGIATQIECTELTPEVPATWTEDSNYIYVAARSRIHKIHGLSCSILGGQAPVNVTSLSRIKGFLLAVGDDPLGGGVPGDQWYSDSVDYATWEVFNNELVPDALQSVFSTFGEIYGIGTESFEVSQISTDINNPFASNSAASQPFGTPARDSVCFDQQAIYYLTVIGGNRQIVRMIGGRQPEIISFPIDWPINDIDDVSNATASLIGFKGNSFYVITFPKANIDIYGYRFESLTLAYSLKNNDFYIWGDWSSQNNAYGAFRGVSFSYVEPWNKRFVGGNDGTIYEIDANYHYSGTDLIRGAIRTGNRNRGNSGRKVTNSYTYNFKQGVGNTDVSNPIFQHRWRDDYREIWSNPRTVRLGAQGERFPPPKTYICGMWRNRQDEIIFSDPCEYEFYGLEEEVNRLG